jgi:hypothetical protein
MSAELKGAKDCIRVMRVTEYRLREEMARLRRNWAGAEGQHATLRRQIAEWENRTGFNHRDLLEDGSLDDPLGTGEPVRRPPKDAVTRASAQDAASNIIDHASRMTNWQNLPIGVRQQFRFDIERIVHEAIRRHAT